MTLKPYYGLLKSLLYTIEMIIGEDVNPDLSYAGMKSNIPKYVSKKYLLSGLLLSVNINDLLEDPKHLGIKIFQDTSKKFMEKLENSENHQNFIGLLNLQIKELISVMNSSDDNVNTSVVSPSSLQVSKACSSNTLKTPKSVTSKIDLEKIKKFSPLVMHDNKIRCSAPWCKSKFSYKRSYDKGSFQK